MKDLWSIAFWIKGGDDVGDWETFFRKFDTHGFDIKSDNRVGADRRICIRLDSSGGAGQLKCYTDAVCDDNWHFIVYYVNNGNVGVSVDGASFTTETYTVGDGLDNDAGSMVVNSSKAPIELDNIMVFDYQLTQAQVSTLWNGGDGTEENVAQDEELGYHRALGEYRGLFSFDDQSSSIILQIPNQSCDDSYFTISGLIPGNKTTFSKRSYGSLDHELIHPVSEITLGSGIPRKAALGNRYHTIELNRRYMNMTALSEGRSVKRLMGKTEPFVYYENLDRPENVFLVKRIGAFDYQEAGIHNYQDSFFLEELAG